MSEVVAHICLYFPHAPETHVDIETDEPLTLEELAETIAATAHQATILSHMETPDADARPTSVQ